MLVATGSYSGNSTDDRDITVGFQPEVVIVKADDTAGAPFRTDAMTAGNSNWLRDNAGLTANVIQAFGATTFQVGTDGSSNTTGDTYNWLAFADNGDGDLVTSTYTGNGIDDRSITDPAIDLSFIVVKGRSTDSGGWRTTNNAAGESLQFHEFGGTQTNKIQNFVTNGFQVGTDAEVNTDTVVYDYFCIKSGSSSIALGSYTGNSTDDREITGAGFAPEAAITKDTSDNGAVANTTDTDSSWSTTFTASAIDRIQSLDTDGFTVGTDATANATGSTYFWAVFRDAPATAVRRRMRMGIGI